MFALLCFKHTQKERMTLVSIVLGASAADRAEGEEERER